MNSLPVLPAIVNSVNWAAPADVDFIVAISEPEISECLSPFMLGVICAEKGEPFCPEEFFAWDGDMLAYTEGFESVAGESEITRAFKDSFFKREPAIEDDHEWISRGC